MSDWIVANRFLNQAEMENNAYLVSDYFSSRGWSAEAIAGMIGNMEKESTINPGIWQRGVKPYAPNAGYGLTQWTPYTKYSRWAGAGWEGNGYKECERINYEKDNGLQWGATSKYPIGFDAYWQSNEEPGYLAQVWLYNYEKPADLNQPIRSVLARKWYEFLTGRPVPPDPPEPPDPPVPGQGLPIWLYFKFKR